MYEMKNYTVKSIELDESNRATDSTLSDFLQRSLEVGVEGLRSISSRRPHVSSRETDINRAQAIHEFKGDFPLFAARARETYISLYKPLYFWPAAQCVRPYVRDLSLTVCVARLVLRP